MGQRKHLKIKRLLKRKHLKLDRGNILRIKSLYLDSSFQGLLLLFGLSYTLNGCIALLT